MNISMHHFRLAASLCAFLVAGCSDVSDSNATRSASTSQQTAYLDTLYAEYFAANLELNPLAATFMGDHRFNDRLANILSEEHRNRQRMLEDEYLALLSDIDVDALDEQARLSYRLFKRDREIALEQFNYPSHLLAIDQFYNLASRFAMLGSGESAQPFEGVDDYEDWAQRMEQIPTILDQAIINMEEGMAQDIVQPRVLMERALPQIESHLVEAVSESLYYAPVNDFPEGVSEVDKVRLTELYATRIEEDILPAYQRLHDFIQDTYLSAARTDSYGLGALPGGDEWYAFNVRWQTTTDMTPDEIHTIGQQEVDRIHGRIRDVMEEVGFAGNLADFFDFTRTVYQPYDEFGALIAELWRSIRLVVDTGIHAKGWSHQQVLDYMYANAPVAEARAVSEAERIMALPGQALAYKIGQTEIRKLRREAEAVLGDNFDIRDFYREVLRNGSLPLSVLREQIERWIATQND